MGESLSSDYQKKIVNRGPGCPLLDTYTAVQIAKRIFCLELNEKREQLIRSGELATKRLALYGCDSTTTVRVYMRETVSRIAAELFYSDYSFSVENVYSEDVEELGYCEFHDSSNNLIIPAKMFRAGPSRDLHP